jgi:uncharacterized protein (DUF2267 family)
MEVFMASHFENYAQEGNAFLRKVASQLGDPDDSRHAFRVVQAIFHALRDRITMEESLHLISELPMALKAVYVNNWKFSDKPETYETKSEFFERIKKADITDEIDFGSNPEEEVKAVFGVLSENITEGEFRHVKGQLPKEIAEIMEEAVH